MGLRASFMDFIVVFIVSEKVLEIFKESSNLAID